MKIDNLTSTDVYVDVKIQTDIYINSNTNNRGVLEIDERGNQLVSEVDSGYTPLGRLVRYNGGNNLMLHNISSGTLYLLKEGDIINIDNDFEKGIRYYINAEVVTSNTRLNNKFFVDTKGKSIFRVILGGREVKNYSYDLNGITIQGNDVLAIDRFSNLVVYLYGSSEVEEDYIGNVAEISYKQYEKVQVWGEVDSDSFLSYLEGGSLLNIEAVESIALNPLVNKTAIKTAFKGTTQLIINSIENTLSMETFLKSDEVQVPKFVGVEEFRVILSNPTYGRCVIINNCLLDSSESLIYSKDKNTINMSIGCGNYIDIQLAIGHDYGLGSFGYGIYGKRANIKNSHRG